MKTDLFLVAIMVVGVLLMQVGGGFWAFLYLLNGSGEIDSDHIFPMVGLVLVVAGVSFLATERKIYKERASMSDVKIENIFYILGVLFIIAATIYFAREFLTDLPKTLKVILLLIGVVVTFIFADVLKGRDM